jgi:uncharacterized protein YxjI
MSDIRQLVDGTNILTVDQRVRHWWEILFNFEQRNSYAIADAVRQRGDVEEQGGTFGHALRRIFLGSHRPFTLHVTDNAGVLLMRLRRPFYWILSDMSVEDANGRAIGRVVKRWSFFRKTYDLFEGDRAFGQINSGFFRVWTFPVLDPMTRQPIATIAKKWAGGLRELVTDADKFRIEFNSPVLTTQQRAIIFAAALSIDFDYFENNQSKG